MKFKICSENKEIYFIPVGFIMLDMLLRFFGAESTFWVRVLCVISIFAVLAYNFIPMRIVLDEKVLRIYHIFVRKIGVDAIDRVHLEEYVTRFKGMRTNRVRIKIVYRRKGETRELFLNDKKSHPSLLGKSTGKSSALYDLRNYLNSCISKRKAVVFPGE